MLKGFICRLEFRFSRSLIGKLHWSKWRENLQSNNLADQVSSPVRRELASRLSFAMKAHSKNYDDLESGKLEKDRESYDFNAGISLMLYQNFVSVVLVSILNFVGIISTEPLTWKLIKVWLPVNFIFVGMLITSMFSLKYINVAMVTVLKNVTNVITAVGEMYLFKKHHDSRVWAALFLMVISAISGGITDLSFNAIGYTWQIINCFLTASYSLTLRRIMDTAKQVTKSGHLDEFSMVLLNNTLSLPLGIVLVVLFNEVDYLATTLVGSLNKIPLSVTGILLFKVPTSLENATSIFFGLLAGVFFARAKMRER
nr:GDP-mannose transporter GONST1 isoform X2 [Ipomoea batatas]